MEVILVIVGLVLSLVYTALIITGEYLYNKLRGIIMFNKKKKKAEPKNEEKEQITCPHCNKAVVIGETVWDRLEELQKIEVVAQGEAIEFLQNISQGYDQEHAPLYGTSAEKLQSPDFREKIPVVSDTNISELQRLLVGFYKHNVSLEIK